MKFRLISAVKDLIEPQHSGVSNQSLARNQKGIQEILRKLCSAECRVPRQMRLHILRVASHLSAIQLQHNGGNAGSLQRLGIESRQGWSWGRTETRPI